MASRSRVVRAALALSAPLLMVGCSFSASTGGEKKVAREKVETQTAEGLSKAQNTDIVPNISCPGDLKGEVGATMTCQLTVDGDERAYAVAIEVTSVDGTDVKWSSEVATTPTGE